ncbi:MAG: hypothetical protein N3F07_03985 [Candidatus Micrarchaeota archaeon]|nr:hypothetical protein [Candidatus Micrarchaeota archaeon]
MVAKGQDGVVRVLCEGQESILVASSEGAAWRIALDQSRQAEFQAEPGKSYAIACGNQSQALAPSKPSQPAERIAEPEIGWAAVALALPALFAFLLVAAARLFLLGRPEFVKKVEGGRATLSLKAFSSMEEVEIIDPVCQGEEERRFFLPKLGKGKEWSCAYEYSSCKPALPAKLKAMVDGKEISMLSDLAPQGRQEEGKPAAQKKSVPKAAS